MLFHQKNLTTRKSIYILYVYNSGNLFLAKTFLFFMYYNYSKNIGYELKRCIIFHIIYMFSISVDRNSVCTMNCSSNRHLLLYWQTKTSLIKLAFRPMGVRHRWRALLVFSIIFCNVCCYGDLHALAACLTLCGSYSRYKNNRPTLN